jgi:hypothetical protein
MPTTEISSDRENIILFPTPENTGTTKLEYHRC